MPHAGGVDDITNVLRAVSSPDLGTWTPSTSVNLSRALGEGTNFSIAYKNIAGHDIVHVVLAYTQGGVQHSHLRGELAATGITWGAEAMVGCNTSATGIADDGPAVVIGGAGGVFDFTSAWNDNNTCDGISNSIGNFDVTWSSSPDLGASWATSWMTPDMLRFASGLIGAHWGAPTASGVLTVQTNSTSFTAVGNLSNLWWSTWDGSTWSPQGQAFAADLPTAVNANDWGAAHVADGNDVVVVRTSTGSFVWSRFDGATWSTPASPIPDQSSAPASGPFVASDGTNIWLFVIDTDAAATIRYIRYDGTSWGSWMPLVTTPASRGFLSGASVSARGVIVLAWTEGVAPANQLVIMGVPAL